MRRRALSSTKLPARPCRRAARESAGHTRGQTCECEEACKATSSKEDVALPPPPLFTFPLRVPLPYQQPMRDILQGGSRFTSGGVALQGRCACAQQLLPSR